MGKIDSNQVPIICDTNIWYRISDGRITQEDIQGKYLVGTYMNGFEFCSTPNMFKDFDQLQQAVRAFGRYANACSVDSPIEHIKMVSGHEWQMNRADWEEIDVMINAIVMTKSPPNPELARQIFVESTNKMNESDQAFIDLVNEHRKQIKFKGHHKRFMNEAETRLEHKEQTKQVLTTIPTLQGVSIDWHLLDLFFSTFDEWLRQLSIQPSLMIKTNDWNDLMSLVYVSPGCLYWTEDYRRTTEFIHNCGRAHYLLKADKLDG